MSHSIIDIADGMPCRPEVAMTAPVSLSIEEGQQVAIVGDNAAGKTRVVDMITGRHRLRGDAVHYHFADTSRPLVSDNIRVIAFCDIYGEADSAYYLQQRWNQGDLDEELPTVRTLLERCITLHGASCPEQEMMAHCVRFGLDALLDKQAITLSSGELRKFQIVRALLSKPQVLIIDNPFIGLDTDARRMLSDVLQQLTVQGVTLILVLPRAEEIPTFITHVIPVKGLTVCQKQSREAFCHSFEHDETPALPKAERDRMLSMPEKDLTAESFYPQKGGEILSFNHVSIRYGQRTILNDLCWTVCEGERWALTGANGSGKSTLLSLVCADNPQGYACDIRLFGHRRGSGESIWDIKRHIGYVSPEMHRAFRCDIAALSVVASGLYDTMGLYAHPSAAALDDCRAWMDIFGIGALADRPYRQLSSGEQRLCLLARAFVKDPELLILDEPLHGLDEPNRRRARDIIDTFCMRRHKTLVMVSHEPSDMPGCIDHNLTLRKQA